MFKKEPRLEVATDKVEIQIKLFQDNFCSIISFNFFGPNRQDLKYRSILNEIEIRPKFFRCHLRTTLLSPLSDLKRLTLDCSTMVITN